MKSYMLMLAMAALIGCQKNEAATDEKYLKDVAYGQDPRQKMDIFLPSGRGTDTTGVIVMVHGGAWTEGDKADFAPYVETLRQQLPGHAIVNINYRLANNGVNQFPAQENDVKAALEYVYSRLEEYQLSDRFAFIGASAGAHLALLQAFKYDDPIRPRAVISLFGPANLVALHGSNPFIGMAMNNVVGGTPVSNPTAYHDSSPINFVTASSPATLIFQGGVDPLVPVAQATELKAKLEAAGVTTQYVYYPSEGHGWVGPALTDTYSKIVTFLRTHL